MSQQKRFKTEVPAVQQRLFGKEARDELRSQIRASQPYKHGVIHGLIDDDLLRKARAEILEHLHFTLKETDIYKVNQTGDLANLSGLDKDELSKLESLSKVRAAIYSEEFRDLLSYVTDCGPLSGSVKDLSVNLYSKGCHLLNHDDVIGTRRISYILYLPPPDKEWLASYGGALRLYPTARPGVPEPDVTVCLKPEWNQLAFFRVQPGHSFHDVEEVYVDEERLSIQGWFHVPKEGEPGYGWKDEIDENAARATLEDLGAQESEVGDSAFEPSRVFEPLNGITELTPEDKEYLCKFLRKDLVENPEERQDKFADDSILELDDFLNESTLKDLAAALEVDDLAHTPRNVSEVPSPWKVAKPPHIRRYLYLNRDECASAPTTPDLAAHRSLGELRALLKSPAFAKLIAAWTGLTPKTQYVEARRFRPAHDFTLATTSGKSTPVLELTLQVTPVEFSETVGGYDIVLAPDEDASDDPAVYRAGDEGSTLLTEPAQKNRLTLLLRDPDLLRFIKYVSSAAPCSRWDLWGQYEFDEVS